MSAIVACLAIGKEDIYVPENPTAVRSISADIPKLVRWSDREDDLKAIGRYRDDWDGMGAKAPSPQLVNAAIRLLKRISRDGKLFPPSAVSGTPLGHITMEWRLDNRYLEAELVEPSRVEWMEVAGGKVVERSEVLFDADATSGSGLKDQSWHPRDTISVTSVVPAFAR